MAGIARFHCIRPKKISQFTSRLRAPTTYDNNIIIIEEIGHHEYSDASAGSRIELWSVFLYPLTPWKAAITWHKYYVVKSYHPHRATSRQNQTSDAVTIGRGHLTPDSAHFHYFCGFSRYNILLSSSSPSSVLEFDVQCKEQARRTDQRDYYAL